MSKLIRRELDSQLSSSWRGDQQHLPFLKTLALLLFEYDDLLH